MKKIILIILFGVILFLGGCASMDQEDPEVEEGSSIFDSISYNYDYMSFTTNTSNSDILYMTGNYFIDFKYAYNRINDTELSITEEIAYQDLFITLVLIVDNSQITFGELLSYNSSEFNSIALENEITLGLEDIVLFNSLKILLQELIDSNRVYITKLNYIEYTLDITLDDSEVNALEFLQSKINLLNSNSSSYFDFSENSFDDLVVLFEIKISYEPTLEEEAKLEAAYNIIIEMINK